MVLCDSEDESATTGTTGAVGIMANFIINKANTCCMAVREKAGWLPLSPIIYITYERHLKPSLNE